MSSSTATEPPRRTSAAPPGRPREGGRLWIVVVLAILFVVGVGWLVKYRRAQAAGAMMAFARGPMTTPVLAGPVERKTVPIYLDGLGTVQAFNTVSIKPRVDGQLIKVAFTEGQDVHKGDLLGLIDPAPYQAALEAAEAKKKQDEAQLANAKVDLDRDNQLIKDKIITDQAMATQQALVDGLIAAVAADQAGLDSARVQVEYCSLTSPLDGRCGIRQVDQGNVIHSTDSNDLVTITQLKPISVVFTLPEQYVGQLAGRFAGRPMTVLAVDRDNKTLLGTGALAVIDNQIDTTTGTIRLKATFPNDDLRLWPGQFVNARVLVQSRTGLVVPASVIQRGPDGDYAYVIKDGAAKSVPVTVAQIEDNQALLDDTAGGVKEGDVVVIDGQYRLQEGSPVTVATGSGKAHSSGGDGLVTQP